ncbi:putative MFS family arabinose efflux permease [Kocuria sp. AG109]|nr:putative MFS family arabinose efflux permease [Kocuria sp. AG109]
MPAANPAPGSPVEGAPRLTRTLLLLMCLATGLCAGGNYFNQPLLDRIAQTLGVSEAAAAGSVTVAQVAYAVGLLLITPLGDLLERGRLTVGLILLTAAGQLAAGFAPVFGVFLLGVGAAGLFSVAAQVLVPYAALLAPPGREGRAVGTVMSGLLAGILVARAVAGLLAELGGWTLVYRVAALLMVLVALGLWRTLPPSRPQDPPTYLGLFASMARLLRTHPRLSTRSLASGFSFASISAVFATTALLLSGPGFGLGPAAIGLISLTGLAGTLTSQWAGRLTDRGLVQRGTGVGVALLAAGWGAFVLGGGSVVWFCVGMAVADGGLQLIHILSMNAVYALEPSARARLNSVYMTVYFVGAAVGSAAGVWAWDRWGWSGVCGVGFALTALTGLAAAADLVCVRRQPCSV